MILFENDWKKYPNAVVHWETRNRSFVEYCQLLKIMGIKNNLFPLALYNRALVNVDPHDPDLPLSTQLLIKIECKLNPWYFFRECLRAPPRASMFGDPVLANRGNIAYWWLFFLNIMMFLIMVRQSGKSMTAYGMVIYLCNIRCLGLQINWLTKDHGLRQNTIIDIKKMEEQLPPYMRIRTKYDIANSEQLHYSALRNRLILHVPQKSEKDAEKVGRGFSSEVNMDDEGPYQDYLDIMVPAMLASGAAVRDIAIAKGEPACNAFTTTAGGLDTRSGKYMYGMISDAAEWTERFMDAGDMQTLHRLIKCNSRSGDIQVNITLNHRQVGKTDEWLYRTMRENKSVGDGANKDFFNKWTSGGKSNPLDRLILDKIKKSEKEPYVEIAKGYNYILRWYVAGNEIDTVMQNTWHVMTLDTSEMIDQDDLTLKFVNVETGGVTASSTFNTSNTLEFSNWLATLFVRFSNFVCIPERRSTGPGIIDNLLYILPSFGINPFKRIFNWVVNDSDSAKERFQLLQYANNQKIRELAVVHRQHFGFATSGGGVTSRSALYSETLRFAAENGADKVHDKKTIDQICCLETRNGRVDHPVGGHDDLVIAWLLGFWFLSKAKNLAYYGMTSSRILSRAKPVVAATREQHMVLAEQRQIRDQIRRISVDMETETSEFILERYERQLNDLNMRLVLDKDEVFSVDDLINKIKEKKKKKAIFNRGRNYWA